MECQRAALSDSEQSWEEEEQDWSTSPRNPLNWSATRRWASIIILSTTNMVANMTPAFEPALNEMMHDFGSTNQSLKSMAVSMYVIGYCLGPLFVAPMSEVFGRIWIIRVAYIVFVSMLLACSLSTSMSAFIAFRTIMGFCGIVFVLLGPAMVPDLMKPSHAGVAISLMTIGQTSGMTLGPIVGGFIVQRTTWRWILGSFTIAFAVLAAAAFCVLRETYTPILRNKSLSINEATEPEKALRLASIVHSPWTRPLRLLFTSPIVLFVSLYSTLNVGYLLLVVATLGLVFQNQYQFTPAMSGLAYLGMTLGILVCQFSLGRLSDSYATKMERKRGVREPEDRLQVLIFGALLIPTGLFCYGWGLHTHWIVPIIGTLILGAGIVMSWLPITMYLVDVYVEHAASANGARTMVQSMAGALLPLAADPLYERFGYDWGNSLLAFVGLAFVPLAALLVFYGKRIRGWG